MNERSASSVRLFRRVLKCLTLVAVMVALVATQVTSFTNIHTAFADEFTAPNQAIHDEIYNESDGLVSISTADIESIESLSQWLTNQKSFITVRQNNGKTSYYFNTPNLQKSIANSVQQYNTGGWQFNSDKIDSVIEPDSSKWTTALKKYGYNVPDAHYVGEYPAPQLNVGSIAKGMANPINGATIVFTGVANWVIDRMNDASNALDSAINFFGGLVGFQVDSGNIDHIEANLGGATPDDIKGVSYNTSDYDDSTQDQDKAVAKWLEDNWNFMSEHRDVFDVSIGDENGDKLFDEGVIVYSGENPGGNLSGSTIYSRLINKVGLSYVFLINMWTDVANDKYGKKPPRTTLYRNMPYDLSNMSDASKSYMNYIPDPRVTMMTEGGGNSIIYMQNKMYRDTLFQTDMHTTIRPLAIICSFAGMLNSICDLDFVRNEAGLDLFWLWKGSIGELILIIACLAFLIIIVRGAIGFVTSKGAGITISKMITSAILSMMLIGLIAIPDKTGDALSNIASSAMSYGTNVISVDDAYKEFYTDEATQSEKTELRYWMLYFNAYCSYATNSSFNSDAMKFDASQGRNEYINFNESTAKLTGDDKINNWGAVLLESCYNHSLDAYRVTDHVMAPVITDTGYPTFSVKQNEYYNGYMYSSNPGNALMISLAVLIFTILKLLCFIELLIDMMLFTLKLSVGAIEGSAKMKDVVKQLLADILKIIVYELAISLSIYMSFTLASPGVSETIISFGLLFASIALVIYLFLHPYNLFAPGLFNTIQNATRNVAESFRVTKEGREQYKQSMWQVDEIDEILAEEYGYKSVRARRKYMKLAAENKITSNKGGGL